MHLETGMTCNDTEGTVTIRIEGEEVLDLQLDELKYNSPKFQADLSERIKEALVDACLIGYKKCRKRAVDHIQHL